MSRFITRKSPELRNFLKLAQTLSCESDEVPATIERERMMFGLIKDIGDLKKAPVKIQQTQFEIKIPKSDKNALGGKIRVRRSMPLNSDNTPGEVTYTLTVKTELANNDENSVAGELRFLEVNSPTTEEMYKTFQYLAEGGMNKIRYEFPIEGTDLKWEFDIFPGPDGKPQPWCKIDLEVPDGGLTEQPPFPIEMERIISSKPESQSEEEKVILDTLFSTVFKFTNPHLK